MKYTNKKIAIFLAVLWTVSFAGCSLANEVWKNHWSVSEETLNPPSYNLVAILIMILFYLLPISIAMRTYAKKANMKWLVHCGSYIIAVQTAWVFLAFVFFTLGICGLIH